MHFLERGLKLARQSLLYLALAHLYLLLAVPAKLINLRSHILNRVVKLCGEDFRLLLP